MSASTITVPLRILIVENHSDTRNILRMYLQYQGHTVTTAATKEEALRQALADTYDVLLSDIGLADGDGRELIEEACFRRPPFAIAMSGYAMLTHQQKSSLAGFRKHMQKPFDLALLDEFLDEAARELQTAPGAHK